MIRTYLPKRTMLFSRTALGLALALGVVATAPVEAQRNRGQQQQGGTRLQLSREFQAASNTALTAWVAAKARPDVVTAQQAVAAAATTLEQARTRSAQRTAQTAYEAAQTALNALVQPEINGFNGLVPLIVNNDDKFQAGSIGLDIGLFTQNQAIQRQAITMQLDSGHVAPERQPLFHYYVGKFAYSAQDYADARTHLLAATQGGYHDGEADRYLAETYFAQNDAAGGLAVLRAALDLAHQQSRTFSVPSLQRGLSVANDAMLAEQAGFFGAELIKAAPETDSWQRALSAVRRTGRYDKNVLIDLMRLMHRTSSYENGSDYIEYIQTGNNLGLPREVLAAITAGVAANKINADTDPAVRDGRTAATARENLDRTQNLLGGYDRDAHAANARTAIISGAADAFLSYGQPVKAEEFFTLALTKPDVDQAEALMRLGIAQYDQRKFAEAGATFARITGPRQPLAALWAVAANQGAAAPAN